MATIIAPSSNPTPIYNRSGVTIDTIIAGSSDSATPIVRMAGHTVVYVPAPPSGLGYVQLPDDAEIGDVVEIHVAADAVYVTTSSSLIFINGWLGSPDLQRTGPGLYRLITNTNWGAIFSVIH
jgi:hypothetical protein